MTLFFPRQDVSQNTGARSMLQQELACDSDRTLHPVTSPAAAKLDTAKSVKDHRAARFRY